MWFWKPLVVMLRFRHRKFLALFFFFFFGLISVFDFLATLSEQFSFKLQVYII